MAQHRKVKQTRLYPSTILRMVLLPILGRIEVSRAPVAVLISGSGTNMAALLYASRANDCPFEVTLVAATIPMPPG